MSPELLKELHLFLVSSAFGVLLALSYDGLRVFRRVLPHGVWWVAIEDLLYWCAASLSVFAMIFAENDGAIRFFSLGGAILGAFLYYILASRFLVNGLAGLISLPIRIIKSILKKVLAKLRKIR